MKQIVAVVQPYCAQAVLEAMNAFAPEAVTVRESKGFRMRVGRPDHDFGGIYLPKIEISLLARNDQVEAVTERIAEVARTGRLGDGKIFIFSLEFDIDF